MLIEQTLLTNFNAPLQIRQRFDAICRVSGRTRTSVLVDLMESYVISQGDKLAERESRFDRVDQTLEEIRLRNGSRTFGMDLIEELQSDVHTRSNPSSGPIPIRYSDGQEEW